MDLRPPFRDTPSFACTQPPFLSLPLNRGTLPLLILCFLYTNKYGMSEKTPAWG
jgi:hypothetical protein